MAYLTVLKCQKIVMISLPNRQTSIHSREFIMFKTNKAQLRKQIQTNFVAIISLITALSGVFYNSWRDHKNEINQNTRNAAFEVLKSLGELQTVVNYAHFKANDEQGNPIEGWKHVLLVRDLSHLLPKDNMQQSAQLYTAWRKGWETLKTNAANEQEISAQIAIARSGVLKTIEDLQ
jgi:hypothetical protein